MTEPTPKKTIRRKPRAKKVIEITSQLIERRAYELWEAGAEGDHLAHWYRAERELVSA